MIMQLPKKFYYSNDWKRLAYVDNDDEVLYIQGDVNYENLMYSLAYSISGYSKCFYCGQKLKKENRTLDHVFPRNWGGVSITNNLVPCCSTCNSRKSNMTAEQYQKWLEVEPSQRADIYNAFVKENERKMHKHYILPEDWVTSFDVSEIIEKLDFEIIERFGNDKIDWYYQLNGFYPRPIIISGNGWIFKGKHILYHAKVHGIKKVYCVKLDNVFRVKE